MKNKISSALVIILFVAGLSLLLYPFLSNKWNTYRQSKLITNYEDEMEDSEEAVAFDYASEWEKANAYNEALYPYEVPESFIRAEMREEPDEAYVASLNLSGNGMMGIVEVPNVDIRLPIFHSMNEEVLESAVGHLEGSSLPVGGPNTHAVISAHRGLANSTLFTDLEKVEVGDCFYLYILDETLCYEVDQISVVEPSDTSPLAVIEGEDLVTLMTCTPYGVNTHRLLVRGHRISYEPEVVIEPEEVEVTTSIHTNYGLWVCIGLAVVACCMGTLIAMDRMQRKKK